MIITRAPYRVSFFGGGTDHKFWYKENGASIISASIDAYCYITLRELRPFLGTNYRVSWSLIEEVDSSEQISHPAIRRALDLYDINCGMEIHTDGDLPARSGLGSSSTFSAALLMALETFKGIKNTQRDLADKTIKFEQIHLEENVGIQDQIQACTGGFNIVDIKKNGNYMIYRLDRYNSIVQSIESEMVLCYTGIQRDSSTIHSQSQKVSHDILMASLSKINKISNIAKDKFLNDTLTYEYFCELLNESWAAKASAFPDSDLSKNLLKMFQMGLNSGARTGKLLGAGGGGFLMFLVPIEMQNQFKIDMKDYITIQPGFTDSACEIVFSN